MRWQLRAPSSAGQQRTSCLFQLQAASLSATLGNLRPALWRGISVPCAPGSGGGPPPFPCAPGSGGGSSVGEGRPRAGLRFVPSAGFEAVTTRGSCTACPACGDDRSDGFSGGRAGVAEMICPTAERVAGGATGAGSVSATFVGRFDGESVWIIPVLCHGLAGRHVGGFSGESPPRIRYATTRETLQAWPTLSGPSSEPEGLKLRRTEEGRVAQC